MGHNDNVRHSPDTPMGCYMDMETVWDGTGIGPGWLWDKGHGYDMAW